MQVLSLIHIFAFEFGSHFDFAGCIEAVHVDVDYLPQSEPLQWLAFANLLIQLLIKVGH